MEKIQNFNDISKETLTYLGFFDDEMISKIPGYVISKLCKEAAESNLNFYVDPKKEFKEQEISEKAKDLIALIYYEYIANTDEKKQILHEWNLNEEEYTSIQKEKYNYENLFKNKKDTCKDTCVQLVEIKKETVFQKIRKIINKLKGCNY